MGRPSNFAEGHCYDSLTNDGWYVTKRGWPDFFCIKDGQLMVVEVKPKSSRRLPKKQILVLSELARYGIPCYRYSPDSGLKKIE